MNKARIFRPAKTAMQSGQRNTKRWVLEYLPSEAARSDPLMGWAGSADTGRQITMKFDSREDAEDFAQRQGLDFDVIAPHTRTTKIKVYADNFRYRGA